MDDFDIEMGDAVDVPMEEPQVADILIGDDLQEDGEIDEPTDGGPTDSDAHRIVPNKVHIRGLDQLDQNQLKAYVVSHVGGKGADRIEWVNDTSANLVFSTDSAAHEALLALSAIEIADATQLSPGEVLAAKTIPDRPEVALQVRYALESDKKERGAAQKSRFYLFHPEWDPETEEGRRKRDRQYRDRRDGDRYRRGGRNRRDERDDEEPEPFDVNLYDDDAGALARRTRYSPRRDDRQRRRDSRSRSANSRDGRRQSINRDKELFPSSRNKDALRSDRGSYGRGRSASPTRDDRDAIEADLARDREAVRNNREKARSIKERIYTSSKSKELFPTDESRELFPSAGEKKELFPERGNGVSRAAMDQVPNEVLEDRTPQGPFSVRGQARQNSQGIMTIKGTAKSVKELFPNKFNDKNSNPQNSGKELFADRSDGHARRRQRAGDLFD